MTDVKRGAGPVNEEGLRSNASKQQKVDLSMSSKERKEKLSEQIAALQQLVSPYGKTDTASVLLEATDYIKFLQEQVKVLGAPYLYNTPVTKIDEPGQYSLRSKGLCLIPISYTAGVARNNGADIWAPINSTSPPKTLARLIPVHIGSHTILNEQRLVHLRTATGQASNRNT